MSHKVKAHWIPAFQEYHLICVECGGNLTLERSVSLENIIFDVDGECDPGETLSIHVEEEIGIKDHFGGA